MQTVPGDASVDGEQHVQAWLATLSDLIPELVERWELEVGDPLDGGSMGYVLAASRAGSEPVVLKLTYPDGWFPERIAALLRWDGRGAVDLIDHDPRGAMLLERAVPGTPLSDTADDGSALSIALDVARRLWVPAPGAITAAVEEVARWVATFRDRNDAVGRPLSAELVDEAEAVMRELEASPGDPVLLHGDLRLRNLLAAEREPWLAASPQPLVGDREFDLAALVLDRVNDVASSRRSIGEIGRWFDAIADLASSDRERLRAWTLVMSVDDALRSADAGVPTAGSDAVTVAEAVRELVA